MERRECGTLRVSNQDGTEIAMQPDKADLYARYFELCHVPLAGRDRVWGPIVRYLQARYIPEDATILDCGAGYCSFINQIRGREKHALDQSAIITQYADADVRTHVQSCTDLSNLPLGFFDVVFASNLLEHLTLPEGGKMLDQAYKVLKAGGRLILIQPNFAFAYREYFDDVSHVQIFTHVGLTDFLKIHGFSIREVRRKFLPFAMRQSRIPASPWLIRLYLHSPIKPFAGQMLVIGQR
jgi:SAM-dependent methyltransferase